MSLHLLTTICPYCGRENDCTAGVNNDVAPDPGSWSLCWGCLRVAVFELVNGRLVVRLPDSAEQVEIAADPDVARAVRMVSETATPREAVRRTGHPW